MDPGFASIGILDADSPDSFVSITTGVSEINEGDSVDFLFTRDGDLSESLTVQVQVDDPGEVMRGNHWLPTPTLPTSVEFEADQDTVTLSLNTVDDKRDIPDSTLSVTLGGDDGYWIGHSHIASVTVNDDDTAPELTLSISPSEVDEGGELIVSINRPADNTENFHRWAASYRTDPAVDRLGRPGTRGRSIPRNPLDCGRAGREYSIRLKCP